jgi:small subunit ribosomal protein S9
MTQIAITETPHPASLAPVPPPPPAQMVRKLREPKPADKHGWWWGTGRRKSAVARVRIRLPKDGPKGGKPGFTITGPIGTPKTVDQYFAEERDRNDCLAPLKATGTEGKFEILVQCHGGGFMGQAGAILLGVSRALIAYDPTVEDALREAGYLTRDAREVERKKYGQAGARRRFQFSKR